MHGKNYALLFAFTLICGINCWRNTKRGEEQCIEYHKNGENLDLNSLQGEMYAVYYWPPNQRSRDSCEVITFRKLVNQDIARLYNECSSLNLSSEQTVIKASYTNNADKPVNLLYYGSEQVKNMYRACDKNISRYLFIRVDDEYVLGINCSAGGRGMLLARRTPTRQEVQQIIDEKQLMPGREGSPDCPLI